MFLGGVHVFDGAERTMFAKSGFRSEGCCPSLDDYDEALNVLRARWTEECVVQEQGACAD